MSRLVYSFIVCSLVFSAQLRAQVAEKPDDVIRVTTELVQSDVIVLDKKGQFVDGLKSTDFEFRVSGKPRTVLFFDRLTAGSASEETWLAAARGKVSDKQEAPNVAFDRGRTVLFYLDDYHLSVNSITHVRQMLTKFVDEEMGPNDEAAIITATGQLGFLEQLTGEKAVLRRAISKLAHRSFQTTDTDRPPMSEVEALAIVNNDRRIQDYFVEQLLRELNQPRPRQPSQARNNDQSAQMRTRDQYETLVRGRAKSIVDQISALTNSTLTSFERFLRSSSQLPWQKLAFFVSDGFLMVDGENAHGHLLRVADAASRSATTIYSVDARGLISGAPEAARKMAHDYTGRLASLGTRSITASQEPLRTIALEAGGEPILDTNDPQPALQRAIKETANYYQIAWRPEEKDLSDRKFQAVEVTIPGKPDLIVRVRHGFFFEPPEKRNAAADKDASQRKKKGASELDNPLVVALRNIFPRRGLPVSLSAGFIDLGEPNLLVTASMEVAKDALNLTSTSGNLELDLIGVTVDQSGKPVGNFSQNLTLQPAQILSSAAGRIVYNEQLRLPPGLYQVRVAIMEKQGGRIGTATQWIDVPDPKAGTFMLSSLFLGEVDSNAMQTGKLSINASHRYLSTMRLGFMTYIYNAALGGNVRDLALQLQVLRDGQPVLTNPSVRVDASGASDPARIAYGEDLSLSDLPKGKYVLQITVVDRVAKRSAQQQARFIVY